LKHSNSENKQPVANVIRHLEAQHFASIIDSAMDAIISIDVSQRITLFNPAAEKMFGYAASEILGQAIDRLMPMRFHEVHQQHIENFGTTKTSKRTMGALGAIYGIRANGDEFPIEASISQVEANGEKIYTVILRDITQRKIAESARDQLARHTALQRDVNAVLAEGESLSEILHGCAEAMVRHLDAAFARIWTLNEQEQMLELQASAGLYTHLNGAHARVPVGKFKIGLIAAERQPHLTNDVANDPRVGDQEWARREGMVAFAGYPLLLEDRLIGVLALFARGTLAPATLEVLSSITAAIAQGIDRKKSRQALQKSELQNRIVLQTAPDGFVCHDAHSRIIDCNDAFSQMLGYLRSELLQLHIQDIDVGITSEKIPIISQQWQEHGYARFESSYRRKDGTILFGEVSVAYDPGNDRYYGFLRDITRRKHTEDRLREQAALLNQAREAIISCDLQGRVLFWNRGAEHLYGWTAEEVVGRDLHEFVEREQPNTLVEVTSALNGKGEWIGERLHLTKSGREINIESHQTLVRDDNEQPQNVLIINNDITEKKKMETQFLRAQRMESIGTLAGGIAHDLNNILSPILMAVQMLQLKVTDESSQSMLEVLHISAERGGELVKQILSFARGVAGERVELQPKHLLQETVKILKETLPKSILIALQLDPDLTLVNADATQLQQVLMNLCINARDAMPNGGTISIEAKNVLIDHTFAEMLPDATPGHFVQFTVSDSGIGISTEHLSRIFDPFFTTKEVGKGTGLGLSTVATIIKSHEGFVNVYSELGRGTKFSFYLPALTSETSSVVSIPVPQLPSGNGELILVVDDESAIRQIAQTILEGFNYRVVLANDGAEAIAIFAQQQNEIAVVLTDIVMPVMDGTALIRAIYSIRPQTKIIASSGFAETSKFDEAAAVGVKHFLPKPYSTKALLDTLAQLLTEQFQKLKIDNTSAGQ
jgi:PAS domain S-box-containing protein